MRTLATIVLLLVFAAPAQAQGLDKDVLEDIIDKATKDPKTGKKKAAKVAKKDAKKDAKPKTDKDHAKAFRKALRKKKADVNLIKAPFAKAFEFLRKQSELKIVVTKKATEALAKSEITLRGKQLKLRALFDLVVEQGKRAKLRCGVKDGSVWFGIEEERKALKVAKFY